MSKFSFAARLLAGAAGGALLLAAGAASAQTRPTDPSTLDILQVLVDKGVLTQDDANGILGEARKRAETRADVVRVPYVPEALRAEIKEEVKAEVLATARTENWAQPDALPSWLNRFSFNGDVRVRGEWKHFGGGNPLIYNATAIRAAGGVPYLSEGPYLLTTGNRYRTRVRARFGVDTRVSDSVDAGLRFVSGDVADPTSTNETLSPNFDKIDVSLDRAFIRVTPFRDQPMFRQTSAILGKFDNPFFSTEIMWDRDVQFDGLALTTEIPLGDHFSAPRVFGTIGAFPLDEFSTETNDKVLYAAQIGGAYQPNERMKFRLAGAYYYFDNVQSQLNTPGLKDNDETTPRRVQYGNSLFNVRRDNGANNTLLFGLVSAYEVAALTGRAEFKLTDTLTLAFDGEALLNTAYDENDFTTLGQPIGTGDTAWHLRGTIGSPRIDDRGQWQLSAGWRHIGADATLDLFTDSDFGLGGTDQEGFVIRGALGLSQRLSLEASWYSARTIDAIDSNTGGQALSLDVDTAQIDLLVKF